jgi:hypothetical protein
MKLTKVLYITIVLILLFAIFGSSGLVMDEWNQGHICPKILGIPACYIVLGCFIIALIAHFFPNGKWFFFIFIGIVTTIASTGTIGEITETAKCPRTSGGIPMCFISLAICLSLLTLKIALIKITNRD